MKNWFNILANFMLAFTILIFFGMLVSAVMANEIIFAVIYAVLLCALVAVMLAP